MERTILYYKHYFIDFFLSLDSGAQRKIAYVMDVLKTQQRPGSNFVKHIREGVFELRANHEGNIYRAFFIFDEGNIVMLFNGFRKKTQKTPENEIQKAIKLKNEYYAEKK
ncbi:MAG: type II toxin-antitoxin system RelE/ParE family toxin [Bacteroidales bacterium]|nr:type II toxin-antitoxin system RelE/ParE family toxin [Bacteroidales bacterium]